VADDGEFAKLLDSPRARLYSQRPRARPSTDHGENLRVQQLRSMGFGDRAQHLRDPGGALGREEQVDGRRGVEDDHRISVAETLVRERLCRRLG